MSRGVSRVVAGMGMAPSLMQPRTTSYQSGTRGSITNTRSPLATPSPARNRAARFLAGLGVAKGDRVFVMLPRVPDWYDVVLGCIKLGAIPMPATTLLTPRDIAYRVNSAEASVVVVDAEGTTKTNQVAGDCPSLTTRVFLAGGGYGGLPDEASGEAG